MPPTPTNRPHLRLACSTRDTVTSSGSRPSRCQQVDHPARHTSAPEQATVTPIAAAPSHDGSTHAPCWVTFSVDCHSAALAEQFQRYLRKRNLLASVGGQTVSVRFDRTQPGTDNLASQIAFAAVSRDYADADKVIEAVLVGGSPA